MSRPITVSILTSELRVGGAETTIATLAKGVDPQRFNVNVICLYAAGPIGRRLREEGINVTEGLLRNRFDFLGVGRLALTLRKSKTDVLYVNDLPVTQLWGPLAGRLAGCKAIVSVAHYSERLVHRRRGKVANRLTGRWVDKTIVLSEWHRESVLRATGMSPSKVTVIPNGVDVEAFESSPSAGLLKELNIPDDAPVVGILAQLRPEKNHSMFLRVAAALAESIGDVQFLVIGHGDALARLKVEAEQLGIAGRVHFLGLRTDVPQVLAICDVGVLTSSGGPEALPLSLLEFMAAEKPVVATRVGAIHEIVEDGRTGYLVEPHDEAGMADAIAKLLRDRSLAEAMGTAARTSVADRFSHSRMIEQTEDLLEELTRHNGTGRNTR